LQKCHSERKYAAAGSKPQISPMDELVIRLADIFTRHAAVFESHRMARMADAEWGHATLLRRLARALPIKRKAAPIPGPPVGG
jgi:hypothetical protein